MLRDVYRDLRDRRLLSIAIVLIVAIVAVPFLIKGSEPALTAVDVGQVSPSPAGSAPELDPVVLADLPTLRNPRKRLRSYLKKNPFKQQPAPAAPDAGAGADASGGGRSIPTEPATPAPEPSASASTSAPSTSAPLDVASPSIDSSPPSSSPEEPALPPPPPPETRTKVVSFTADVKAGPIGNARVMENVKPGEFVPNETHPVVQFVDGDPEGTSAYFAVSTAVEESEGEGNCIPTRSRCEFLLLKVGEEQRLTYGPDGRTYRIRLLEVIRHERNLSEDDAP